MRNAQDWTEMGIRWDAVTVSKKDDDGVRHEYAGGQRVVVEDYAKFKAHFGDERVLAMLSQSLNQLSTDKSREGLTAKEPWSAEEIRDSIYGRLAGTRGGRVKTIVKHVYTNTLPNGKTFEGTNEVEFRAAAMAAFVDFGLPAAKARELAEAYTWYGEESESDEEESA